MSRSESFAQELETDRPEEAAQEAAADAKSFGADSEWEAAVGQLFLDKEHPELAIPHLREALRLRPSRDDVRRQLATAQLKAHAPEEALATIGHPISADDYYLRAGAFYVLHRLVDADQACREALATAPREPRLILLRPAFAEAHYNLGLSLDQIGDLEQAIESFKLAAHLQPASASIHLGLAQALLKRYDLDSAAAELRKTIQLAPSSVDAHFTLGLALGQKNELAAAEKEFRKAIRLRPEFGQAHLRLGIVLRRQERTSDALNEFRAAARYSPDDPEAHYRLGLALRDSGALDGLRLNSKRRLT